MLRLLQANTILNRYIQTFQVTKILNQRLIQNQLLALPLTGLPQILKSIFSILFSLRGRLIPTSDQQPFCVWILPGEATFKHLLFLEFLAFSFFFFLYFIFFFFSWSVVKTQPAAAAAANGASPTPISLCSGRRQAVIFYVLSFLGNQHVGCRFGGMFGGDKKRTMSILLLSRVCRTL